MARNLIEKCPFREGSASEKIFKVLAKSEKPMRVEAVAKAAKVPLEKTVTLLAAYKNPFHNAPLRRAGVCIESDKGLYSMKVAKVEPNAKRPERGTGKKRKALRKSMAPTQAKEKKSAPASAKKSALDPVMPEITPRPSPELAQKGN